MAAPSLPTPRGPLSAHVVALLTGETAAGTPCPEPDPGDDPLFGDDSQLALYTCYELHYRSFAGVDPDWEWDPQLLAFRRDLERRYLARLRAAAGPPLPAGLAVVPGIRRLVESDDGPSLSRYLCDSGTLGEFREFAVHRSAYQLKEADPHTWAIPRVAGEAKAALVEIQSDEYGAGRAARMHAELFAQTLRALDLDDRYGAYLDVLPGTTLATVNLVSMFGLHRRWRGALVGHLTVFEMTSVTPMGRYARALERHRIGRAAKRFYEAHVEADAVHEVVALDRMAAAAAAAEPAIAPDILFGAQAVLAVERAFAESLLDAWARGRTSLRGLPSRPAAYAAAAPAAP